jgi:hypothetical protein
VGATPSAWPETGLSISLAATANIPGAGLAPDGVFSQGRVAPTSVPVSVSQSPRIPYANGTAPQARAISVPVSGSQSPRIPYANRTVA